MKAKITFPPQSNAPLTGEHISEFKGGIEKKKNIAAAILALSTQLAVTPAAIESSGFTIEFLKSETAKKPGEKKKAKSAVANDGTPPPPRVLDSYTLDPKRASAPAPGELKAGTTWVRRNTRGTVTLEMVPALHPNGPGQIMADNEAAPFKGIFWDYVTASGASQIEESPTTPPQNRPSGDGE